MSFTRPQALVYSLVYLAAVCVVVDAHGFMSQPRTRGALNTQRKLVPQVMDPKATIDYCPHCQNCGGVGKVRAGGPWKLYKPFEYKRAGITMCGDPVGKDDHTSKGQFANPPSMKFAATYKPGSVANFEYDLTTNHNGFISFYLCDVSSTPDKDIVNDPKFFKENCHELERSPHPSCESGKDKTCGPIDSKYPGRFVVPCREPGSSDQVVGGPNGKMAYKIPDKEIKHGVIQAYWLTQNTCNSPDGFMETYKYPSAWAGCPCDGGATGAHPKQPSCTKTGQIPEEFFNCADVRVSANGASTPGSESSSPAKDTSEAPTTSSSTPDGTTAPTESGTTSSNGTSEAPTTSSSTPDGTTLPTESGNTPSENSSHGPTMGSEEDCPSDSETNDESESDATSSPSTSAPTAKSTDVTASTSSQEHMGAGKVNKQRNGALCARDWQQCGGIGHKGPTKCCNSAHQCVHLSAYYYQCKGST